MIVRLSSLGDVVLTSCLIDPLIELGYRPHLLTFFPYGEVFSEDPRLKVFQIRKEELFKEENLKAFKHFDLYIDLHKNLKTFLLRLLLGGSWKVYRKQSIRRRLAIYFKAFRKPYSVIDAYLSTIGYKEGRPKIVLSEDRVKSWKEKLGERYVCIAPGARYQKKRYPYFDKLAELFLSIGYKVVYVGDQTDRKLSEDWKGINFCGQLSLMDVMAVIKGGMLFLGNDSGLLHVARAVGTKAVQVYGGTHPTLGFALKEEEGIYMLKGLYCQPCDLHGKGKCRIGDYPYPCLHIDPYFIFERALSLLPS
ncbi:MAG: glycosyltransferase family 9 protein [Aquificaceae bacterium]|nr:glycosyltransferase family 9 protein [Aquificaceae bacterium]